MNNNRNGAGIGGLVIVILGAIALIIAGIFAKPIFKILLWVIIGIVGLVLIGIVLILIFSNRQSNKVDAEKKVQTGRNSLSAEQSAILQKGRSDLMEIRRVLVKIKSNTIRSKGNEICSICDKILQTLKEKPEQILGTRQFLNYYLPTLRKILDKYQRLEANNMATAEITATVGKYLDDVNAAMNKQYANLFEGDKLDLSVDMEAMTIGLKRDGLLSDADFQPAAEEEDFREEAAEDTQEDEVPLLEDKPEVPNMFMNFKEEEPEFAEAEPSKDKGVPDLELSVVPEPDIPDPDAPKGPELVLHPEDSTDKEA